MNRPATSLAWVFEPPQTLLHPDYMAALPKSAVATVFLSTVFSSALAKVLLVSPVSHSFGTSRVPSSAVLFILNFSVQIIGFFSVAFVMSRVARLVSGEPSALFYWLSAGILALIPLHLTLPLALICRPLGEAGRLIHAMCSVTLWGFSLRRWAWGVQNRYAWPFWGALLVVLSPFLISASLLILSAAFLVVAVCLVFLGLLA